jgi:putative CRISPR-associated protein (TIGR02619 family)
MAVVHLVLVGTSVWRNLASALGRGGSVRGHLESFGFDLESLGVDAELCARARPGSGDDVECGRRASGSSSLARAALEALGVDPYGTSAELNAMRPWLEAFESGSQGSLGGVVLIHSDTGAGSAASGVLRRYLEGAGVSVWEVIVEGLGRPKSLVEGLERLYDTVLSEAGRGGCTLLNPTGGFKVESGYALLAAQKGGALAAYYIHETFRDVVVIPLARLSSLASNAKPTGPGGWLALGGLPPSLAECLLDALGPTGMARRRAGRVELNPRLARLL